MLEVLVHIVKRSSPGVVVFILQVLSCKARHAYWHARLCTHKLDKFSHAQPLLCCWHAAVGTSSPVASPKQSFLVSSVQLVQIL
jgi:hypothetical protein